MAADATLDAQGLRCPLPVLRARKAMRDLPPGATLRVLATDPSAPKDLAAFCRETGHDYLDALESDGVYSIDIRKKR